MRKLIALLALALPIMFGTASAAPNVHLMIDNPAPKFGDTITVSWDYGKGGVGRGESTAVWTVSCYQDRSTVDGVPYELQVWWVWTYSARTFTLGEKPIPVGGAMGMTDWPYQLDNWVDGAAECEVYLYNYNYHQGYFLGYDTVAEYEFEVAA